MENMKSSTRPETIEYPGRVRAWCVVALLLVAYTVALVDRQVLSLMVKPIRAALSVTDTQLSLLAGFAFVLFYTGLGLPCGRLADTTNRRNLIVAGMILWSIATVACGLASTFGELFLARMLVGVGEATLGPAAYSLIADHFPPGPRAKAVSVYTMGVFMGTGSALMFSAAAVALTAGQSEVTVPLLGSLQPWQAAFVVVGLPGLAVAALIALGVREPARHEASDTGNSLRAAVSFVRGNAGILSPMLIGFALNGLINYGLTTWVATLFIRLHGWSAGAIGSTYGAILVLFGSAGVLVGGWLGSRVPPTGSGTVRIARNALACIIPVLALLSATTSPWIDLVALSILAFLIGIPAALSPVALYQVTPNAFRGQIIAFYLLGATVLGLGVGVTLIAVATDHLFHDDQAIGWSLGVVLVPAAALAVFALDRARRELEKRAGS